MAKKGLLRSAESSRRGGARPPLYDRRQANRISLWVILIVAALLGAYVAVELSTDPASVSDGRLQVRSLFGFSVELADIRELSLEKGPIATSKRIIGNDAFGLFQEGEYEVDGLGRARIFVKKSNLSYLTIRTAEKNYAIGLGSPEKDQLLYNSIKLGQK
jgi:hypothetical protein